MIVPRCIYADNFILKRKIIGMYLSLASSKE
jgi:hypothetical protein